MKDNVLCAGETLQDERVNGGAFIGTDGLQFPHKLIPVSPHVFQITYLVALCFCACVEKGATFVLSFYYFIIIAPVLLNIMLHIDIHTDILPNHLFFF